ncbi:MAG: hypothetical protein FWF44_10215 [Defluviitaleaceae bacterium]|nr:hypothetical protein [Defluviitaleaceae bacterium]
MESCYWKAWEIGFSNLRNPAPTGGFVSPYIDTTFNGCIFMWDSCFMTMFTKYAKRVFDAQSTLDNFYAKQHPDGFICREIDEESGEDNFTRFDPSATGPNIMPLAEWEYYLNFGDKERLNRVFPALLAYHQWLSRNHTWPDGGFWSSGWGCGMDNQPRMQEGKGYNMSFSHGHMVWADTCLQQILSAKLMSRIAVEIGKTEEAETLNREAERLSAYVQEKLWDDASAFYYDKFADGALSTVKSIGAYWALLAETLPREKAEGFVAHLRNPNEFYRPDPIPSLSADHPDYQADGNYWRGGVWTGTNYMTFMGLDKYGYGALAHELARKHLDMFTQVYVDTGTIWENYSPEKAAPGIPAKRDFVGWSAITPITVLFEHVFGIKAFVRQSLITWDVRLLEKHGIVNYPFGNGGVLTLLCEKRLDTAEKPRITFRANTPVRLNVAWDGGSETLTPAGLGGAQ